MAEDLSQTERRLRLPGRNRSIEPFTDHGSLLRVVQVWHIAEDLPQADGVLRLPGHSPMPALNPALIKAYCRSSCRCGMWQRTCPRLVRCSQAALGTRHDQAGLSY